MRAFALLVALGILYGSLWPFDFRAPAPGAWQALFEQPTLWTGRGDVLGNVALFVPWGLVCMAGLRRSPRRHGTAWAVTLGVGFALALLAQVLQLWVPERDAQLGDVFWNGIGCVLGASSAVWLAGVIATESRAAPLLGWGLAGTLAVAELLPGVPSLDLALLRGHARSVIDSGIDAGVLAQHAAVGLAIVALLGAEATRRAQLLVPALLVAVGALLPLGIVAALVSASSIAGLWIGALLALAIALLPSDRRTAAALRPSLAALAIALLYAFASLWPFTLREPIGHFEWLPFVPMLRGSMLVNSQMLLLQAGLFSAIVWLAARAGASVRSATVVLVAFTLIIEVLQLVIGERGSEVTTPLLAACAGSVVAWCLGPPALQQPGATRRRHASAAPTARQADRSPAGNIVAPLPAVAAVAPRPLFIALATAAAVVVIAASLHLLLRLAGVPYNVRELWRHDASWPVLATFALALLWLGAGPALLAQWLAARRWPASWLAPGIVAISLVGFALLSWSVTGESLDDILGAPTIYRGHHGAVDVPGSFGAAAVPLGNLPEGVLDRIERALRYVALHAPVALLLCLPALLGAAGRRLRSSSAAGLLFVALAMLLLCKWIAIDNAATDNLVELVAHDAAGGMAGLPWLAALMAMICGCALLAADGLRRRSAGGWLLAIMVCAASLPLGWGLLGHALETRLQMDGQEYTALQFLLGPDRRGTLSQGSLMLRWFALQAAVVALLAVGSALGFAIANALSRRGGEVAAVRPERPVGRR